MLMYKFVKNGIKIEGERAVLCKGHYTTNREKDSITFYTRNYCDSIPVEVCKMAGVRFRNDTDHMTDYFDKDSFVLLRKDNKKLFDTLLPLCT